MDWIGNLPHVGRLARKPYLAMMDQTYARLHDLGLTELSAHHSVVFQCIGAGARMTDMARQAQMTKQNMKHLLEQMETLAYVERREDPTDRRAVIFRLTPKGEHFRDTAYRIIGEIEREWASRMGGSKMLTLKQLLAELNAALEEA